MEREFKVGDKVRIRQWDDMAEEFGVDEYGDILCSTKFVEQMKSLCGEEAIIKLIYGINSIGLQFINERYGEDYSWTFSKDMIELIPDVEKCGYTQCLEDMRTAIRKISSLRSSFKCCDLFGCSDIGYILDKFTPLEIIKTIEKCEIKEGDLVRVRDIGKTYSTYADWVVEHIDNKDLCARYAYDGHPSTEELYEVIKIANGTGFNKDRTLAYIGIVYKFSECGYHSCFLVDIDGLKKEGGVK